MVIGDLAEVPFLGLLQTFIGSGRSGALVIEGAGFKGIIYFQSGLMVHAEAGRLRGGEALFMLAGLRRGQFRFDAEAAAEESTIPGGLEVYRHLAEALDFWKTLENLPHHWGDQLRRAMRLDATIQNEVSQWIYDLADNRSVSEVLLKTKYPVRQVAQTLDQMIGEGYLEVVPQLDLKPAKLVVLPLYGKQEGIAFLDDELYRLWEQRVQHGFNVRLKLKGAASVSLPARPRPNFRSRLGLFEKDIRKFKLSRGDQVDVWPEIN
ncbi:MAG: DUF4388 domain-containing protein [Deinococcus sp.]|nr:DUF4388 domain-containing protein [Deinococcus sp.]